MGDVSNDPIDAYLDELFDELAGMGAAGRRVLLEADDHLHCIVNDEVAQGADLDDAARHAVERLGPASALAANVRDVRTVSWRRTLARLAGAAWVLGAVALLTIGLSGGLAWAAGHLWGQSAVAGEAPGIHYSAARCDQLLRAFPQRGGGCRAAALADHYTEQIVNRLAAGSFGLLAAASWVLGRRRWWIFRLLHPLTVAPPMGLVSVIGASAFGVAAALGIGQGVDAFMVGRPWGAWAALVSGLAAVPAFAWFAARTLQIVRRSDGGGDLVPATA